MTQSTDKLYKLDSFYFLGSEEFVRTHRNVLCTEGVIYVAEEAGAYWLLDIISSCQTVKEVKNQDFQVYHLRVDLKNSKAVLECSDGNKNVLYSQKIKYTDFPREEIKIWYVRGTAMLPSEY